MEAGRLRHRINIEDKVVTQDNEGGQVFDWALWAENVPAEILPVSGRELLSNQTLVGTVTTKITIRWRPGVAPTMRLTHDGTVYNVQAVIPDGVSGRDSITFYCDSGANDGQAG